MLTQHETMAIKKKSPLWWWSQNDNNCVDVQIFMDLTVHLKLIVSTDKLLFLVSRALCLFVYRPIKKLHTAPLSPSNMFVIVDSGCTQGDVNLSQ